MAARTAGIDRIIGMKKLRHFHPMYCIAVRTGPSHGTYNMYRKFDEIWMCGFWDIRAERQTGIRTNRQTDIQTRTKRTVCLIAILCTSTLRHARIVAQASWTVSSKNIRGDLHCVSRHITLLDRILNKYRERTQPCRTPFLTWNHSDSVPATMTLASCFLYSLSSKSIESCPSNSPRAYLLN